MDRWADTITIDGQTVALDLWDTNGGDEPVATPVIWGLCLRDADVALVCFSVTDPASFESVK